MQLIKLLSILVIQFSCLSQVYADVKENGNNWKIHYYDSITDIPNEIPFFDENNTEHSLEKFEGKTVLVIFWASWCASCNQEITELDILKKDFRKLPIEILPISIDYQGIGVIKKFYQKNDIKYLPIFHDYQNQLFTAFQVSSVPTSYIINSEGQIKAMITGVPNWHTEELRNLLLKYISGNPIMPKNSHRETLLNRAIKLKEEKEIQKDAPPPVKK